MANVKITGLPTASLITSDDLVPIVDGVATTQKATFQQVLDYVTGSTFGELTVVGAAQITGSLSVSSSTSPLHITRTAQGSPSYDADASIILEHNGTNNIQFVGDSDDAQNILFRDGANGGLVGYEHDTDTLSFAAQDSAFFIDQTKFNFNEDQFDLDFIVKTVSSTAALFVSGGNGNVGMGTSTPSTELQVVGTISGTQVNAVDSTISNNLQVDNGLGVGMAPGVVGTVRASGLGSFQAKKSGDYDRIAFIAQPVAVGDNAYIAMGQAGIDEGRITAASVGGSAGNNLTFHTGDTAGVETEKVRITISGDVGIGTSTPAAKLDVSGSLIADVALSGAVGSEITSTSYTLSADDRGKTLLFSSSATQGITCSSGLSVGYNSTFIQLGSGQLELTASGVSVLNRQSHTKSAGLYAAVSVVIVSADTYILAGDTSA